MSPIDIVPVDHQPYDEKYYDETMMSSGIIENKGVYSTGDMSDIPSKDGSVSSLRNLKRMPPRGHRVVSDCVHYLFKY